MLEQRIQRRIAAPVALLAAIALAAGGGSSRLPIGSQLSSAGSRPQALQVQLIEHIELVALRSQPSPADVAP